MCGSCLILWFKLDGTSRSISSVTAVRASYGCSTGSRKARPERHQRSIHVTWRPGMGLNTSAAHRRGLRTKTIRPFGNQTLLMPPDSSTAAVSSCAWPNAYTHTHNKADEVHAQPALLCTQPGTKCFITLSRSSGIAVARGHLQPPLPHHAGASCQGSCCRSSNIIPAQIHTEA